MADASVTYAAPVAARVTAPAPAASANKKDEKKKKNTAWAKLVLFIVVLVLHAVVVLSLNAFMLNRFYEVNAKSDGFRVKGVVDLDDAQVNNLAQVGNLQIAGSSNTLRSTSGPLHVESGRDLEFYSEEGHVDIVTREGDISIVSTGDGYTHVSAGGDVVLTGRASEDGERDGHEEGEEEPLVRLEDLVITHNSIATRGDLIIDLTPPGDDVRQLPPKLVLGDEVIIGDNGVEINAPITVTGTMDTGVAEVTNREFDFIKTSSFTTTDSASGQAMHIVDTADTLTLLGGAPTVDADWLDVNAKELATSRIVPADADGAVEVLAGNTMHVDGVLMTPGQADLTTKVATLDTLDIGALKIEGAKWTSPNALTVAAENINVDAKRAAVLTPATMSKSVTLEGAATVHSKTAFEAPVSVEAKGALTVDGAATLATTLTVHAPANLGGAVNIAADGALHVKGDAELNGAVTKVAASGALAVKGERAELNGDVVVTGAIDSTAATAWNGDVRVASPSVALDAAVIDVESGAKLTLHGDAHFAANVMAKGVELASKVETENVESTGDVTVDVAVHTGALEVAGTTTVGGDVHADASSVTFEAPVTVEDMLDVVRTESAPGLAWTVAGTGVSGSLVADSRSMLHDTTIDGDVVVNNELTIVKSGLDVAVSGEWEAVGLVAAAEQADGFLPRDALVIPLQSSVEGAVAVGDTLRFDEFDTLEGRFHTVVAVAADALSVTLDFPTDTKLRDGATVERMRATLRTRNAAGTVKGFFNSEVGHVLDAAADARGQMFAAYVQAGAVHADEHMFGVEGNLSTEHAVTLGADLTVGGSVHAGGDLTVHTDASAAGELSAAAGQFAVAADGAMHAAGSLAQANTASMQAAELSVGGDLSSLAANTVTTGGAHVGGNATVGTTFFAHTLSVEGAATVAGNVHADQSAVVVGDLAATGALSVTGDAMVHGDVEAKTLHVHGKIWGTGNLTVTDGDVAVTNTLALPNADVVLLGQSPKVTTDTVVLKGGGANAKTWNIDADSGNLVFASPSGAEVSINENNMTAQNDLNIGGSLSVAGSSVTVHDATVDGAVHVAAGAEVDGGVAVQGNLDAPNATVEVDGTVSVEGALSAPSATVDGTVGVDGDLHVGNNVVGQDAAVDALVVANGLTAGSLRTGPMTVGGAGDVTMTDVAAGATTLTGNVSADVMETGVLSVGGNADLSDGAVLDVDGSVTADGELAVSGDVTAVGAAMSITGNAAVSGTVAADGMHVAGSVETYGLQAADTSVGENIVVANVDPVANSVETDNVTVGVDATATSLTVGGADAMVGGGLMAQSAVIGGTLTAGDVHTSGGGVEATGDVAVDGALKVLSSATGLELLDVNNDGFVYDAQADGNGDEFSVSAAGAVEHTGALSVGGALTTTLHTHVEASGALAVGGSLSVGDAATVDGTVSAKTVTVDDVLTVAGDVTVNGSVSAKTVEINTASGALFVASADAVAFNDVGVLMVDGTAIESSGTIAVTGDVFASTLTVDGSVEVGASVYTSAGMDVGQSLRVAADANPNTDLYFIAEAQNVLLQDGSTVLFESNVGNDATQVAGKLESGGDATFTSTQVAGAMHAGTDVTMTSLTVGTPNKLFDVTAAGIQYDAEASGFAQYEFSVDADAEVAVSGNVDVGKSVTVDGALTTTDGGVSVGGTADVLTTLSAPGSTSVDGSIDVGAGVTNSSTLVVDGNASAMNDVQVDGDVSVGGDWAFGRMVTVGGNAAVTGDVVVLTRSAVIDGLVTVAGNAIVGSSVTMNDGSGMTVGNGVEVVSADLGVTGSVLVATGSLHATGDVVADNGVTVAGNLSSGASLSGRDLTANGDAHVGGAATVGTQMVLEANASIGGGVTAQNVDADTLSIALDATASGALEGGNTTVGGDFSVTTGGVYSNAGVSVGGDIDVGPLSGNSTLGVGGTLAAAEATVGGDVTVHGTEVTVGDDLTFVLSRPAATAGNGGAFDVTGQHAAGSDNNGGEVELLAGAPSGTQGDGGNVELRGGSAPTAGGAGSVGGNVYIGGGAESGAGHDNAGKVVVDSDMTVEGILTLATSQSDLHIGNLLLDGAQQRVQSVAGDLVLSAEPDESDGTWKRNVIFPDGFVSQSPARRIGTGLVKSQNGADCRLIMDDGSTAGITPPDTLFAEELRVGDTLFVELSPLSSHLGNGNTVTTTIHLQNNTADFGEELEIGDELIFLTTPETRAYLVDIVNATEGVMDMALAVPDNTPFRFVKKRYVADITSETELTLDRCMSVNVGLQPFTFEKSVAHMTDRSGQVIHLINADGYFGLGPNLPDNLPYDLVRVHNALDEDQWRIGEPTTLLPAHSSTVALMEFACGAADETINIATGGANDTVRVATGDQAHTVHVAMNDNASQVNSVEIGGLATQIGMQAGTVELANWTDDNVVQEVTIGGGSNVDGSVKTTLVSAALGDYQLNVATGDAADNYVSMLTSGGHFSAGGANTDLVDIEGDVIVVGDASGRSNTVHIANNTGANTVHVAVNATNNSIDLATASTSNLMHVGMSGNNEINVLPDGGLLEVAWSAATAAVNVGTSNTPVDVRGQHIEAELFGNGKFTAYAQDAMVIGGAAAGGSVEVGASSTSNSVQISSDSEVNVGGAATSLTMAPTQQSWQGASSTVIGGAAVTVGAPASVAVLGIGVGGTANTVTVGGGHSSTIHVGGGLGADVSIGTGEVAGNTALVQVGGTTASSIALGGNTIEVAGGSRNTAVPSNVTIGNSGDDTIRIGTSVEDGTLLFASHNTNANVAVHIAEGTTPSVTLGTGDSEVAIGSGFGTVVLGTGDGTVTVGTASGASQLTTGGAATLQLSNQGGGLQHTGDISSQTFTSEHGGVVDGDVTVGSTLTVTDVMTTHGDSATVGDASSTYELAHVGRTTDGAGQSVTLVAQHAHTSGDGGVLAVVAGASSGEDGVIRLEGGAADGEVLVKTDMLMQNILTLDPSQRELQVQSVWFGGEDNSADGLVGVGADGTTLTVYGGASADAAVVVESGLDVIVSGRRLGSGTQVDSDGTGLTLTGTGTLFASELAKGDEVVLAHPPAVLLTVLTETADALHVQIAAGHAHECFALVEGSPCLIDPATARVWLQDTSGTMHAMRVSYVPPTPGNAYEAWLYDEHTLATFATGTTVPWSWEQVLTVQTVTSDTELTLAEPTVASTTFGSYFIEPAHVRVRTAAGEPAQLVSGRTTGTWKVATGTGSLATQRGAEVQLADALWSGHDPTGFIVGTQIGLGNLPSDHMLHGLGHTFVCVGCSAAPQNVGVGLATGAGSTTKVAVATHVGEANVHMTADTMTVGGTTLDFSGTLDGSTVDTTADAAVTVGNHLLVQNAFSSQTLEVDGTWTMTGSVTASDYETKQGAVDVGTTAETLGATALTANSSAQAENITATSLQVSDTPQATLSSITTASYDNLDVSTVATVAGGLETATLSATTSIATSSQVDELKVTNVMGANLGDVFAAGTAAMTTLTLANAATNAAGATTVSGGNMTIGSLNADLVTDNGTMKVGSLTTNDLSVGTIADFDGLVNTMSAGDLTVTGKVDGLNELVVNAGPGITVTTLNATTSVTGDGNLTLTGTGSLGAVDTPVVTGVNITANGALSITGAADVGTLQSSTIKAATLGTSTAGFSLTGLNTPVVNVENITAAASVTMSELTVNKDNNVPTLSANNIVVTDVNAVASDVATVCATGSFMGNSAPLSCEQIDVDNVGTFHSFCIQYGLVLSFHANDNCSGGC